MAASIVFEKIAHTQDVIIRSDSEYAILCRPMDLGGGGCKAVCAIHLPENRRKVHYITQIEVGKYMRGKLCRYKTFSNQSDAAHFRNFGVVKSAAWESRLAVASPARSEFFEECMEDVWKACEASLPDKSLRPCAVDENSSPRPIFDGRCSRADKT